MPLSTKTRPTHAVRLRSRIAPTPTRYSSYEKRKELTARAPRPPPFRQTTSLSHSPRASRDRDSRKKDNASHLYHSPPSSAAATPSTTPTQPPPTETECKKATVLAPSISPFF